MSWLILLGSEVRTWYGPTQEPVDTRAIWRSPTAFCTTVKHVVLLGVVLAAHAVFATAPESVLSIRLSWEAGDALGVCVESKLDQSFDATLIVTAGEYGERKILSAPINVQPGATYRSVHVAISVDVERVHARVIALDDGLEVNERIHIRREASGKTRLMPEEEVEAWRASERERALVRNEAARLSAMRAHVRDVIARGSYPSCSEESAPLWNRAVLEELGNQAPARCRELTPPQE